jgi:rhodanese-related sulfurtransferase
LSKENIQTQTKIYVYCRSGNRSAEAINIMRATGFTNLVDLGGVPDVQAIGGVLAN